MSATPASAPPASATSVRAAPAAEIEPTAADLATTPVEIEPNPPGSATTPPARDPARANVGRGDLRMAMGLIVVITVLLIVGAAIGLAIAPDLTP